MGGFICILLADLGANLSGIILPCKSVITADENFLCHFIF